jgi:hypothetical protein
MLETVDDDALLGCSINTSYARKKIKTEEKRFNGVFPSVYLMRLSYALCKKRPCTQDRNVASRSFVATLHEELRVQTVREIEYDDLLIVRRTKGHENRP